MAIPQDQHGGQQADGGPLGARAASGNSPRPQAHKGPTYCLSPKALQAGPASKVGAPLCPGRTTGTCTLC